MVDGERHLPVFERSKRGKPAGCRRGRGGSCFLCSVDSRHPANILQVLPMHVWSTCT